VGCDIVPSEWQRLREFLQQDWPDVHPVEYVRWFWSQARACLTPRQLRSDALVRRFVHHDQRVREDKIRIALEVQQTVARQRASQLVRLSGFSNADAVINVLFDNGLELSSLFRYCLACNTVDVAQQAGEHALAARFIELSRVFEYGAAMEYLRGKKHYQKHWGKWLPADLEGKAADAERRGRCPRRRKDDDS
jgi:hypothetical protein